jgi:hypothetical protein
MEPTPNNSDPKPGHLSREAIVYVPNEFQPYSIPVTGGSILINGIDEEVIAEINNAGIWSTFEQNMRAGENLGVGFLPRGVGQVAIFLFVGMMSRGGFISITGPDTIWAKETMSRIAAPMLGYITSMHVMEET